MVKTFQSIFRESNRKQSDIMQQQSQQRCVSNVTDTFDKDDPVQKYFFGLSLFHY